MIRFLDPNWLHTVFVDNTTSHGFRGCQLLKLRRRISLSWLASQGYWYWSRSYYTRNIFFFFRGVAIQGHLSSWSTRVASVRLFLVEVILELLFQVVCVVGIFGDPSVPNWNPGFKRHRRLLDMTSSASIPAYDNIRDSCFRGKESTSTHFVDPGTPS